MKEIFERTKSDRYGSKSYTDRTKWAIGLLFLSYTWITGSILAHLWVWQATHQGISDYGVFFFGWVFVTSIFGALALAGFVELSTKEETK